MGTDTDKLSDRETASRREAALKKMLATPPKPHKAKKKPNPAKRQAKKGK
jgi:hypothetical protein